jgi:5-methylcytosine-specific restriction endonuclease McrA
MSYTKEHLDDIYERTSGYCHICHKKLARINYASSGARGAWEVDHSKARSRGGTDHGNNLLAACVSCNREKSNMRTALMRALNGKQRAPLSPLKRKQTKFKNGVLGAVAGGVVGAIFGPPGIVVGSIVGGCIAGRQNPDRE